MSPQLEVLSPGSYASVQDVGRRGLRRVGVPWAGALDPRLMRLANALAGLAPDAPVIECFDGGLQLAARGGAVRLAVAGDVQLEAQWSGQCHRLSGWRSLTLADGDQLRVRSVAPGRIAMVAVEGLALPPVLGSVATYARARLGGVGGQALTTGMRLQVAAASDRHEQMLAQPPQACAGPIRAVTGPQADHFSSDTLAAFAGQAWRVSAQADRMGVRLEGPPLVHSGPPEIVSDATVPGSIQVPGNGRPIVLLADAQTAGGYPKIGTVISADLPRLAAARPGQVLRFAWISAADGERLARENETATLALLAALRPLTVGGIDETALYNQNLLSGFVHALAWDALPEATPDAAPPEPPALPPPIAQ